MQLIVDSFLLISFFIMVAAFSAYMSQNFKISTYVSATIFSLVCYIVFEKSLHGMMKINSRLVPFLLIFISYLGIKSIPYVIQTGGRMLLNENSDTMCFLISSILYTSYNSIILIPVLISMKSYINTDKQIKQIATLSGILIIILSLCMLGLLSKEPLLVKKLELPILEIVKGFGLKYQYLYSFIVMVSIFTSAISAGYSFLKNISKSEKMYRVNVALICLGGILVAKLGFSNLVAMLYPIFGMLGIIEIIMILMKCKREHF